MAQIIGNNTPGGFSESFDDPLKVLDSKFTAPVNFPQHFEIQLDKVNTFDGGDLIIFKSWQDQI